MTPPRLVALFGLVSACAGTSLPDEPVLSSKVFLQRDIQLKSGLRVVVQEDHGTPLVVVSAIYGAGAMADPAGAAGLAHLLEHLTYRSRLAGTRLSDWLKGAGASFNARTSADTTLYYASAQRSALSDLLQIEMWRLLHTIDGVSAEELQTERHVVLNERWEWQSSGLGPDLLDDVQKQLFPAEHPLSRPILGTETTLGAVTLPALRAFVAEHYRPENCTLVIAGDVKAEEITALMSEWPAEAIRGPGEGPVGQTHRPPLARAQAEEPPPVASTAPRAVKGPVTEPHLVLAWSLPGLSGSNGALLDTVADAIESITNRLHTQARIAVTTRGSLVAIDVPLGLEVSREEQRQRLLDMITSERAVTIAREATPELRWQLQIGVIRATADPISSAISLTGHLANSGRPSLYKDSVEQLLEVDANAISGFLRKYITRERAATLFVDPNPDASSAHLEQLVDEGEQHQLGRASTAALAGMTGRDILRVVHAPGFGSLPRFRLSNGLEVVLVTRPASPIAQIDLLLPGGDASPEPYGFAGTVLPLSIAPCAARHVSLRRVAGSVELRANRAHTEVTVVVPEGNLANGLASLSDQVGCREVEPGAFGRLGAGLDRWEKDQRTPQQQARAAFWGALYPGHPYGRRPDLAGMRRLSRADANERLAAQFRPTGALAVVMSARPTGAARSLVEEFLSDWKPSSRATVQLPPPPPPGPAQRVVRVFDRPRSNQVQLLLGCRLPAVTSQNMPVLDVLEQVVREQADELREGWGATYGLQLKIFYWPGSAHLVMAGAVEASKAVAGLDRLLALLEQDATAGPDVKTFTVSRWEVARQFNPYVATAGSVLFSLQFAASLGLPLEAWDAYPVRLANTARTEVRDLMKSCAGHEVITLVGDGPGLSRQLAARGLLPR